MEEEEAAEAGAAAELAQSAVEEISTWVGLETVFASFCWLTTEGCRRRAPGTAAGPWNVLTTSICKEWEGGGGGRDSPRTKTKRKKETDKPRRRGGEKKE